MRAQIIRIRKEFLDGARERIAAALTAVDRPGRSAGDEEGRRALRSAFRWVAAWGAGHGFPALADLARDGGAALAASAITRDVVDAAESAGWKALATRVLATADGADPSTPARSSGRILLFTRRPDAFASAGGPRCVLVPPDVEVVTSVAQAVEAAGTRPFLAVALDLAAPLGEVLAVVRAAIGRSSYVRPCAPLIALSEGRGILDRFRFLDEGVHAILPATCAAGGLGSAIATVVHETEVRRGRVFVLGPDPEVTARVRADLEPEGFAVEASPDLPDLLGRWTDRPPDAIVVAAVRGAGPGLFRAVRDLRDDPHARSLPIVVAFDRIDAEQRRAAFEAGATEWLPTPWLPAELASRVCRAIDIRELAFGKTPEAPPVPAEPPRRAARRPAVTEPVVATLPPEPPPPPVPAPVPAFVPITLPAPEPIREPEPVPVPVPEPVPEPVPVPAPEPEPPREPEPEPIPTVTMAAFPVPEPSPIPAPVPQPTVFVAALPVEPVPEPLPPEPPPPEPPPPEPLPPEPPMPEPPVFEPPHPEPAGPQSPSGWIAVSKLLAWDDSKPADDGEAAYKVQLRLNLNGKGVVPPENKTG